MIPANWPRTAPTQMNDQDDDMLPEYDLSRGVRGKFYRGGAQTILPVHLEPDVLDVLRARAEAEGVSLDSLVNALLKERLAQPAR